MIRYCCILFLLFSTKCFCQYKVRFVVTDNAMYNATKMHIAGNFNSWNPADKNYALVKIKDNTWETTLSNIAKGEYSFKFTQGSWQTVEDSTNGAERSNRLITINSDTSLYFTTLGWRVVDKPRNHTASKNVHIISDSFYMPQLKRKRKIWIYLPANYKASKNKYPVLYMHDAQNLFDEFTAPFGEWNVDETLDSLQKQTGKYCIVVGIDHGGEKRLVEYNPYDTKEFGKGEGEAYAVFLVKTLKPFIDKNYRTNATAAYTAIAGSSMGGLISTYTMLKYPTIFGSAGLFSPAYWIAPSINDFAKKEMQKNTNNRFWFYGGGKEGYTMMEDMENVKAIVAAKAMNTVILKDENAKHNEVAWRKWFPEFYLWWVKGF
jgi:predicted alpha/beta superfamily hydrolase